MLTDGLMDGLTDGKADAYVTPCYRQVRQKLYIRFQLNGLEVKDYLDLKTIDVGHDGTVSNFRWLPNIRPSMK